LPGVYSSADIVIFPTLEDVWGLVANEAVLCGLRVLCSRYAGCAEELFQEESIVNPEDEEDFVVKLRRAVQGQLPPPNRSRILSTSENLKRLVRGIYSSLPSGTSRPSGSGVFESSSK
jgi:glycosyltransferase involved in cell wall biosynthesis